MTEGIGGIEAEGKVGKALNVLGLVKHADHGFAWEIGFLAQETKHAAGVVAVEGGDRFVGEVEVGLLKEGPSDGDPLLLAA